MLLVLEGYAYLVGTIAVFAAVLALLAWGVLAREPVAGLVALFLGLPTVLLNGAAIRSLVFSAPSPKGVPLTASTAPKLITMIEEVQQTIGCRALKGVLVVPACNASAYQAGSIWRPRNFLLIGYPLLLVLSPEQLKAVVAHELAHFANGDSRLAGLVYRIRVSWLRLAGVLNERGTVPIFVRCVFTRYLPRLEAGSAEVARAHEFFADQAAAAVSSPTTAAEALIANDIAAEHFGAKFWPSIAATPGNEHEPPRPFTRLYCTQLLLASAAANADVLNGRIGAVVHPHDTHPTLMERLNALGERLQAPKPPEQSAGDAFLGPELTGIARRLDAEWLEEHGAAWSERDAIVRGAVRRLKELDAEQRISGEQLVERGRLLEELGRESDALDAYRAGVEREPNNAEATLSAGRLLLTRDAVSGVDLVSRSMDLDDRLVPAACEVLIDYYTSHRRLAEAERYRARWARQSVRRSIAQVQASVGAGSEQAFGSQRLCGSV